MSTKANSEDEGDDGRQLRLHLVGLRPSTAAVSPVTPASAFGSAPTVCGTISSRRAARAAFEAASVPLPSIGHGDVRDGGVLVDLDRDRLVHAAAGERPLLELGDRRAHCRRVHVRRLDDDVRGQRRAGERLLHPVVRLDDGERLRERLGSRGRDVQLERRRGERQQQAAGEDGREHGPAQDAVDDRAPDPAFAVVAAEPAEERDAQPVDLVAEPREQGGQHGQRAEHRDGDDEDRRDAERGEGRVAGQEHAGHRHHHRQAGDEHRAAGGGGGGLERRPLAAPGGPLLRSRFK